MKLIPALDILDGKVVRLKQGDYNAVTIYHKKPKDLAWYLADHGAERLHLVDLRGSKEGKICEGRLFTEIRRAVNIPCEAGGGIRSATDFRYYYDNGFEAGKDFVMVGSLPFVDRPAFDAILAEFAGSLLMTVDAWGTQVKHSGWLKDSGVELDDFIAGLIKEGVQNFLVTQIKKDGMMAGPDYEMYERLLAKFPQSRIIASGGVSSMDDLKKLATMKLYGAIVGKAYYEGKITAEMLRNFRLSRG
ncbi:MAG TPA: 1-(5-phosphoribosyl)-5-[(5-phosphoribosylamino)methylideneamino] imidazole-4-carboxamide isomerase [Turneriella sp.]|nr:1-(5-phosphoribosyl)-5-[(5-phosphoribosylamino)methylideneamino] imidazole-4-carboxamide isomerase [Turneriella sp.]